MKKKRAADGKSKGQKKQQQRGEEAAGRKKRTEKEADAKKPAKKKDAKANKRQDKEAVALAKRKAASSPFGHCWRPQCQAPLKVVPPMPGDAAMIGCPRYRTRKCGGYLRPVRPEEAHLLPNKFSVL